MAKQRQDDRRVQRTRQALQQAFVDVIRAKGEVYRNLRDMERRFTATSIQEITERANVNRGTFYLHYADKYMLADAVVREWFQQILQSKTFSSDIGWDDATMLCLVRAILSGLEKKFGHQPPTSLVLAPLFERIAQEELSALLVTWLAQMEQGVASSGQSRELDARVVSWAILGTAVQWSQEESRISLDEMAQVITQVVMGGVARVTADPFQAR